MNLRTPGFQWDVSLNIGLFIIDREWNILDFNDVFPGLMEAKDTQSLVNANILQLLGLDPSGFPESLESRRNITFTHPDTGVSFYLSIRPLEANSAIGFISCQGDALHDEIWCNHYHYHVLKNQQIQLLESRLEGLIHNINTPLNTIIGYVQILLRENPESKALQKIMESGFQIDSSLKCILDRVEASRTRFRSKINVNKLIVNELEFARNDLFFKHNVKVETNLAEEDLLIDMVYSDLSFCINALLWNAIESLQERENRVIQIRTAKEDSGIQIILRDHGMGIHPKDMPYIFQFGFTTKSKENCEHLGLGLSFTRQVIEDNEGRIVVRSEYELGTTASIYLPLEVS